ASATTAAPAAAPGSPGSTRRGPPSAPSSTRWPPPTVPTDHPAEQEESMSYWPATAWTVTDPSAPPRPAIDSTADGKRRPPAWMPHILRPYCRNRLRRGAFLALCGGALALAAPGPIAFVRSEERRVGKDGRSRC